ncbi:MAG: SGNH/GDSL hydrolase family protein, partial [Lachnospiraceae bacterium]|nr:SGNH/GDSL hydrolase family protein [Lachnospiraceae bacterium]
MDEAIEKYLDKEIISRSVANTGDTNRLTELFGRAEAGEKLTIAFLGGSITQGCLSSIPEKCYAYLVYDWFVRTFPKSEFTYVNAGIGGTTSQFGAARLEDDVLLYKPDFCMVEYSVNDSDNAFFRETYESVVSRILESKTQPAVMILHNLFYKDGHNAQKQHLAVGKAYGVPCVSVRDAIFPEIETGKIQIPQLSSDGLHPNDDGHAVLAALICHMLEEIRQTSPAAGADSGHSGDTGADSGYDGNTGAESGHSGDTGAPVMAQNKPAESFSHPKRLTPDAYCTVRRVQNKDGKVKCRGFSSDNTPKENMLDIFKCGWKGTKNGDEIEFEFTGTELAVQYRKTINRPAPVAVAVIDDDEKNP